MKFQTFEIGLSDCHKLVCSILKASFKKLPSKIIKYRNQKHFDQIKFLHYLGNKSLQRDPYKNCDKPCEKLSENFVDTLNNHAPLKEKLNSYSWVIMLFL